MKDHAKVVVIGGGIFGASLCYFLAKRGVETVLLERNEVCSATSSATAAWMWPTLSTGHYGELMWAAYDRYLTLEEELGRDFEFRITGGLELLYNEEQLDRYRRFITRDYHFKRPGACILSPQQTVNMEPVVNPNIVGAAYSPYCGHVNPFLLVNAYIQNAKRYGAEVNTFTKVEGFETEDNHVKAILTNRGKISGDIIVGACGIYTRELGRMLGFSTHLYAERAFCLVSERMPKVLNTTLLGARQTVSGNIVLGYVFDKVDADFQDRRMYQRGLNLVTADMVRDVPGLRDINIIRTYVGLRCKSEDRFPIVGPTKYDNFWMLGGHSAFILSPGLSDRYAAWISGETDGTLLTPYLYSRYGDLN